MSSTRLAPLPLGPTEPTNQAATPSAPTTVDLAGISAPRSGEGEPIPASAKSDPKRDQGAGARRDKSAELTFGRFGADIEATQRERSPLIPPLDLGAMVEIPQAVSAANQRRHEELRNAGLESVPGSPAPGGRPGSNVSIAARSVQDRQDLLSHDAPLLLATRKRKTGNREVDDFIEQHPELAPLALRIQNELAAADRAEKAGRSSFESKGNLEAALDRIATLLEGQPIAPMLRMGDRTAQEALVKLLAGTSPEGGDLAFAIVSEVSERIKAREFAPQIVERLALDDVTARGLIARAEAVGRLQGRIAAGGDTAESAAQLKEAEGERERYLAACGDKREALARALRVIEQRERERGLLERVSERVYELEVEAALEAARPGGGQRGQAAAALQEYLRSLTPAGLLSRHPSFGGHLEAHRQKARGEATELLRLCRESAAAIERSSHWTLADGGTAEQQLCRSLEGRSPREIALINGIYTEDFGKGEYPTVEALIRGETEGEWRTRALRALSGDPARSRLESCPISEEALSGVIRPIESEAFLRAFNAGDQATLTAFHLESVVVTSNEPVLALVGEIEDATARGVSGVQLGAALQAVGFDPVGACEARVSALEPRTQEYLRRGRELVAAAVAGQTVPEEAVRAYMRGRAEHHAAQLGWLEVEERPAPAAIEALERRFWEESSLARRFGALQRDVVEEHKTEITHLRDQARVNRIFELVHVLNRDIGVAEVLEGAEGGARTTAARERLQAFERGHENLHADLKLRYPRLADYLDTQARQSKRAGEDLARDVKKGIDAFQQATTKNWFWGEAEAAAAVVRGKDSEWLKLFKEEFAAHTESEGETAASAALTYVGEPSEPEFDRVHALLFADTMGALAADTQMALAARDRAGLVEISRVLTTSEERAELSAIFTPRYAAQNTVESTEPVIGSTRDRTVVHRAQSLDEAIGMTFQGDEKTIVSAALAGDTDLQTAAEVNEARNRSWKPVQQAAQILEGYARDRFGRLDGTKIDGVVAAFRRYTNSELADTFSSKADIPDEQYDYQRFAKLWGRALIAKDDLAARAAKLKTALAPSWGDSELAREAAKPGEVVTEVGHTLQLGKALTSAQIHELLGSKPHLSGADIAAILKHHGQISAESDEVTREGLAQIGQLENTPPAIRSAVEAAVEGAMSPDDERQLVAYARYCGLVVEHRATHEQVATTYAKTFQTPLDVDLREKVSDFDYQYTTMLRRDGVVSRALRYVDALERWGTNQPLLDELTIGLTKTQAQKDCAEHAHLTGQKFEGRTGDEFLASPLGQLVLGDVSGDYGFDVAERLRGKPETIEEEYAAAKRRFEHEDNSIIRWQVEGNGALGFFWRDSYNQLKAGLKQIEEATKGGQEDQVRSAAAVFNQAADQYRFQKNMIADTVANGGAIAVVAGGLILTGGAATPLVLGGTALVGGGVRISSKALLKGDAFGWEEVIEDSAVTGVDLATLGLMSKVPAGAALGRAMLQNSGEAMVARGVVGAVTGTTRIAEREALIAIGQSSRAARTLAGVGQGAVDGAVFMPLQTMGVGALREDWSEGVVAGLNDIFQQGLDAIPHGLMWGAGGGALAGLFSPGSLKLARAIDSKTEAQLLGRPGTVAPEGGALTARAREHLLAVREGTGVIRRSDVKDAQLMSRQLSPEASAKLIEKAKNARLAESEVKVLEQRLKKDGALTHYDRDLVKRGGSAPVETPTVLRRREFEALRRSVDESRGALEIELAQPNLPPARRAELEGAIRGLDQRAETLSRLDTAMTQVADAVRARLGPIVGLPPVTSSGAGAARSTTSDGGVTQPTAAASAEPPPSAAPAAPHGNEGSLHGATPPDSPAVVALNDKLRSIDEGIAAREKFVDHIQGRLTKADGSPEAMVDVAEGVPVPRDVVERQLVKDREGLEALRAERAALDKRIQAERDTARISAERREMAAADAAKVRAEARKHTADQTPAATVNRGARAEPDRTIDEGAAQVRRSAADQLRARDEIERAAIAQRELDRGAPIERYVPKNESAKPSADRLKEVDERIAQKERFVELSNQKLAEGGDSIRFGDAAISRREVELGVKGVEGELAALRAERDLLRGGPRTAAEPAQPVDRGPVSIPRSEPIAPRGGSAQTDGGTRSEPRSFERSQTPEPEPLPLTRPANGGRGQRLEFKEPVVDPQVERLLARVGTPQLDVVEPSPAVAQRITAAQDAIKSLESKLAKLGPGVGIEEHIALRRQELVGLEARAVAQHELKRDLNRVQHEIELGTSGRVSDGARRYVDDLAVRLKADDGSLDLEEIAQELAVVRRSLGIGQEPVGAGQVSTRHDDGAGTVPTRAGDDGGSSGGSSGDHDLTVTPDRTTGGGGRGDDGGGVATLEKPVVQVEKKIDFEKQAEELAEQISRETAMPSNPKNPGMVSTAPAQKAAPTPAGGEVTPAHSASNGASKPAQSTVAAALPALSPRADTEVHPQLSLSQRPIESKLDGMKALATPPPALRRPLDLGGEGGATKSERRRPLEESETELVRTRSEQELPGVPHDRANAKKFREKRRLEIGESEDWFISVDYDDEREV